MSKETASEKLQWLTRSLLHVFGDNQPSDIIFIVDNPSFTVDSIMPKNEPILVAEGGTQYPGARSFFIDGVKFHFVTESELRAK